MWFESESGTFLTCQPQYVIHANMVYLFTPIMFEAVLLYSSFLMIFAVLEESAGLLGSILMNDRVSGFCTSTKLVFDELI